jgi:hypothetical protein
LASIPENPPTIDEIYDISLISTNQTLINRVNKMSIDYSNQVLFLAGQSVGNMGGKNNSDMKPFFVSINVNLDKGIVLGTYPISFPDPQIPWNTSFADNATYNIFDFYKTANDFHFTGFSNVISNSVKKSVRNLNGDEYDSWYFTMKADDILVPKNSGPKIYSDYLYGAKNLFTLTDKILDVDLSNNVTMLGQVTNFVFPDIGNSTFKSKLTGGSDILLFKINSSGNVVWDRIIGGDQNETSIKGVKSSNGNYILATSTLSSISGFKKSQNFGKNDAWILGISNDGNILFEKDFGGFDQERPVDLYTSKDNNIYCAINSDSNKSGNRSSDFSGSNLTWLIKLSPIGELIWEKSFEGSPIKILESPNYDGKSILVSKNSIGNIVFQVIDSSGKSILTKEVVISNFKGFCDFKVTDGFLFMTYYNDFEIRLIKFKYQN